MSYLCVFLSFKKKNICSFREFLNFTKKKRDEIWKLFDLNIYCKSCFANKTIEQWNQSHSKMVLLSQMSPSALVKICPCARQITGSSLIRKSFGAYLWCSQSNGNFSHKSCFVPNWNEFGASACQKWIQWEKVWESETAIIIARSRSKFKSHVKHFVCRPFLTASPNLFEAESKYYRTQKCKQKLYHYITRRWKELLRISVLAA